MTATGDRRKLFAKLRKQGYTIEATGSDHFAIHAPDGRRIDTVANSASDWRAARNLKSRLRRSGLDI